VAPFPGSNCVDAGLSAGVPISFDRGTENVSVALRVATPADLEHSAAIENAADALLIGFVGPGEWYPAPTGLERAALSGFILISAEAAEGAAVGFVHVIEVEGFAHIEQLSVLPSHAREGRGRALVEAAKFEATARGYSRISLRTFAAVPWNAPFYATCGFVESEPSSDFHRGLVEAEILLGIRRYGRRIEMTARTRAP
jgi:GNAT superfamily N-acetyltransferase